MPNIEYVRVKNKAGYHESVPVKKYEARKDRYQLLKQEAVDRGGNPLPPSSGEDEPVTAPRPSGSNK